MILNDELNIGNILGILTELKNIKGTHPNILEPQESKVCFTWYSTKNLTFKIFEEIESIKPLRKNHDCIRQNL